MKLLNAFLFAIIFCFNCSTSFAQEIDDLLTKTLNNRNFSWVTYESANFKYYTEKATYPDKIIDSLMKQMEACKTAQLAFLNSNTFSGDKTNIFIVDNSEKIIHLLGFEAQGFTMANENLIFLLNDENFRAKFSHEFMHLFSYQNWGRSSEQWLDEGLAVYYDSTWSGYDVDLLSKHLKDRKAIVKLSRVIKDLFEQNPMIVYPELGSFTRFLIKRNGIEKLRELWTKGSSKSAAIYGLKLADLEKEWLQGLDKLDASEVTYLGRTR